MIVDKEKKKKTRPVEGPAEEEEKLPASVEENGPSEEELRKEAQAELERAKADAEEFKRKWYAVSAEYENYRKRTVSQSAQRYREGRADVVAGLFPVADNLSRAIASCRDEATLKGLDMVMKAFSKLLADEQITEIDPKGEPFDAEKHEAIMAVDPVEGEESGTVREVYAKGYEQNGKVLRFAQVSVVK